MVVAASGILSLPLEHLRTLLAASATFQAWVGAADADAAKAHIYLVAFTGSAVGARPLAIVRHTDPATWMREAQAGGARHYFTQSGTLELLFEADITEADNDSAEFEFTNIVGAVIAEMEALAASGEYLAVTGFSVSRGPVRAHPAEAESEGNYYQLLLTVDWSGI